MSVGYRFDDGTVYCVNVISEETVGEGTGTYEITDDEIVINIEGRKNLEYTFENGRLRLWTNRDSDAELMKYGD